MGSDSYSNSLRDGIVFQRDGNIVLYNTAGKPIWSSKTQGKGGEKLVLQNNGDLDLLNAAGVLVWSSDTHGKEDPDEGETS